MSNISKDSLIGIHNNNDNNSSLSIVSNNKDILSNQKIGSSKHNHIMTEENYKIAGFNEGKLDFNKDKKYKKGENLHLQLNRMISKSNSSFEKEREKNNSDYNDNISFNLFHYYCLLGNFCEKGKEKEIELFNSGISLYKKRLDIVNVFTFLLLIDNFLVENQDFYSF